MNMIKLRQLFSFSSPFILVLTLTGCGGGIGVSEYRPSEFNSHQRYDDTSVANYQEGAFPSYQISSNGTVSNTTHARENNTAPVFASNVAYSDEYTTQRTLTDMSTDLSPELTSEPGIDIGMPNAKME